MQESEKDPILSDDERQHVSEALESILATEKFEAAPQMSAFLRYVVEQAADGNQSRIKAFTVAVDALGKPDTFDPQNDPVVRVLAGRLRAALSAYNDENPNAAVVIKMTPGSYVPTFVHQVVISEKSDEQRELSNLPDKQDLSADEANTSSSATETPESTMISISDETAEHSVFQDADAVLDASPVEIVSAHASANSNSYKLKGMQGKLAQIFNRAPKLFLAGVLLASLLVAFVQNKTLFFGEPDLQAALSADRNPDATDGQARARPDDLSLFISAIDNGNAFENNLNAVISSIISESGRLKVYRILDKSTDTRFWPEDYILTMTALDLPDETRVNMQLMEAATGRIVHSQVVRLNEQAFEQLTQKELDMIIDSARSIVNENGPMTNDYAAKEILTR
ncbi:MAG: hypothetical protein AB8B64_14995 [Granulosicoccus sp.]